MSNYNARVPADQQYQLILECRSSGLSDYQWCKENKIRTGTFYNWVSRLRKKACCEIPVPASRKRLHPPSVQEVVKLDLLSKADDSCMPVSIRHIQEKADYPAALTAMVEISLGNTAIRIANGTDPAILDRILSLVKGAVC